MHETKESALTDFLMPYLIPFFQIMFIFISRACKIRFGLNKRTCGKRFGDALPDNMFVVSLFFLLILNRMRVRPPGV